MEQFEWLVKQRNKALGLFGKVLRKLDDVHAQMHTQVEMAKKAIGNHESTIQSSKDAIEQNKGAIDYLEAEKAKTLETRKKITDLVGGS